MQQEFTSVGKSGAQSESWLDRVLDRIKPQPSAPESPAPPPVDQTARERSVGSHRVDTLTIHDVELIVFNEMQPYGDRDNANESLASAREKIAHALMNADHQFGVKRGQLAPSASPIEPSAKALQNPRARAAYESSLTAARNAYLSLDDPTHGATNFGFGPLPTGPI
jgi:hypothetical protein